MRRFSAVFALATGLAIGASIAAPSIAGTLYQWTGSDGTPTYSPDPPPAGVKYELVGDDLKPLPKNVDITKPVQPEAASPAAATAAKTSVAASRPQSTATQPQNPVLPQKQAAAKPVVPWKPVRYADDPSPPAKTKVKTSATNTVDPVTVARNSPACIEAKQQMALLEGQFAQAFTDEQMDRAVLRLQQHKPALQSACMLN